MRELSILSYRAPEGTYFSIDFAFMLSTWRVKDNFLSMITCTQVSDMLNQARSQDSSKGGDIIPSAQVQVA